MVYAGKPSTGCQTCRSRHIKCDEARPHCRACVRSGRSCPGYKDPFDVMLRGQKAFLRKHGTSRSTRLSNGDSSRQDSPVSMASGSSGAEHTEVEESPQSRAIIQAAKPSQSAQIMTPSIPAGPYLPLEDIVAPLFFNSYLYVPKDPQIAHGYMWLLPEAFSNARSGSHLHLATLAVSFFSVAAWTGQRSLLRSSEELFLKALPRTREALQHDVDHSLHDVLLTILLLNAYEEFHAMKERSLPPKTHLRGAVALVNSRRPAQPDSPNSKILAHAIQTQIARTSLGAAHPVVQAPNLWPLSTPMGPTAPSQLTIAASQLVNLRLTWEELTSRPQTPTNGEIADILSKANYLDAQLATWTYCLPSPWTPIPATTIPAAVREAGLFQGRCDCYQDMWIASVWNFYRGTRISLQQITLNCLRILQHDDTSPETQSTLSTIRNLTTGICASVPFFLGSQTAPVQFNPNVVEYPEAQERRTTPAHRQSAPLLGGWFVLAYLGHVCSPGLGLDEEQLEWIQGQMRRVLRIYSFESRIDEQS